MVGFSLVLRDPWCNCKFSDMYAFFFSGLDKAIFYFFTNDMFSESRDKMFDAACYYQPVRIGGNKFHCISDIISPQACIAIDDKSVILSYLHISQAYSCRVAA